MYYTVDPFQQYNQCSGSSLSITNIGSASPIYKSFHSSKIQFTTSHNIERQAVVKTWRAFNDGPQAPVSICMHALLHRGHADGYWGRSAEPRRMSFPSRGSTSWLGHICFGNHLTVSLHIWGTRLCPFIKTGRFMRRTQVLTSKFYPGSLFSCF